MYLYIVLRYGAQHGTLNPTRQLFNGFTNYDYLSNVTLFSSILNYIFRIMYYVLLYELLHIGQQILSPQSCRIVIVKKSTSLTLNAIHLMWLNRKRDFKVGHS